MFIRSRNLLLLVCATLSTCHSGCPAPEPTGAIQTVRHDPGPVSTDNGSISGTTDATGKIRIFRGVPFAAPPVGELRWKEPQPVAPWKGIRKCSAFGPSPIQEKPNAEVQKESGSVPKEFSEDCLYLNVWTGAGRSTEKRPVIVWIYGGGFTAGSSALGIYDGEALAKKGVVFVSFNYRVGVFGFLAHPALSRESRHRVSGNYGLLDQIAALKWVKKNIAAFGGDPDNITIDGESAGSCSVNALIGSPLARALFRRAIAESGSFFRPNLNMTLKQAEEDGLHTMQKKNANTLEAMRALPAEDLMKGDYRRLPTVDGYVLPDQVINLFKEGQINKADLLTGYNEGDNFPFIRMSRGEFLAFVQRNYGSRADDFFSFYPAHDEGEASQSQNALARDLEFGWAHYTWAREQSSSGKTKAYMYYFDHVPPGEPNLGAYHSGEIGYAFHTLDKYDRPWTERDRKLSDVMSDYWVNFAATGDPNGKGLPKWPAFTPVQTKVIAFGDEIRTIDLPAMRVFRWFDPYPE